MIELEHIYVALTALGAVLSLVLAYQARRRRAAPGSGPLTLLMLDVSLWFVFYWAVWSTGTAELQLFWLKMSLTATLLTGPMILAFTLDTTGVANWRTPRHIALLSIAPALSFAILWMAPTGLLFADVVAITIGEFTHYSPVFGPLFYPWLMIVYSLIAVSIVVLVRAIVTFAGAKRAQAAIVLTGMLIPFAVSVLDDLTGFGPPGDFDPVPLAILFSSALFLYALSRGWLLGLVSRARDLIVESMKDGVIILDGEGLVVDANPAAAGLIGVPAIELLGAPAANALARIEGAAPSPSDDEGDSITLVSIRHADGLHHADMSFTSLTGVLEGHVGSLIMLHDVTEAQRAKQGLNEANERLEFQLSEIRLLQDELRQQAIRDPLTNLFNRRFLEESMIAEIARAQRSGQPIAFMVVDIDSFKHINDSYSHQAGDATLVMVSSAMVESVRAGDIVARTGGDEFVLILPGCEGEPAFRRAESIRTRIAATPLQFEAHEFSVTVSVGIAVFPSDGDTSVAAIAAADDALYAAKESGRDTTRLASQPS